MTIIIILNAGHTLGVIEAFDKLPLDSHWKPDPILQQTSYDIDNNIMYNAIKLYTTKLRLLSQWPVTNSMIVKLIMTYP